jgi:hypothetical protein
MAPLSKGRSHQMDIFLKAYKIRSALSVHAQRFFLACLVNPLVTNGYICTRQLCRFFGAALWEFLRTVQNPKG